MSKKSKKKLLELINNIDNLELKNNILEEINNLEKEVKDNLLKIIGKYLMKKLEQKELEREMSSLY